MNRILPLLIFLFLAASIGQSTAQIVKKADTLQKVRVIDPSLKGQYESLLYRSKSYYGAKLIIPARLTAFYQNVADSIRKERASSKNAFIKIREQAKTIDTLNSQIKGNESSLANSNAKLDQISFLGIPFSKSAYNTLVWSIIIVLALALAFVVIRSAKNISEAKYRTELYDEVSKEYQTFKVKANEKEKKLARELQDERNKLEELKNRGN